MAKVLTLQEKIKMADIYKEAGLKAINTKSFTKYRKEWYRKK